MDLCKTLEPLSIEQLLALIDCFENNKMKQTYPGRVFGNDIGPALEIVKPIIDRELGEGNWTVRDYGGNFFETNVGYRVHADTGTDGPESVFQTFVFPLRLTRSYLKPTDPERVRFMVLNQRWQGPAAFFMHGDRAQPKEYNTVINDYRDVIGLEPGNMDAELLKDCPHLNRNNFSGLSVDKNFQWIPGVPMTFPRDRLHVNSAFTRYGYEKKLGLSIFTSRV
jgi:hypothetical protein